MILSDFVLPENMDMFKKEERRKGMRAFQKSTGAYLNITSA